MGRKFTPTSDYINLGNVPTAQFLVGDTWSKLIFFRLSSSSIATNTILAKWRSGGHFQIAVITVQPNPPKVQVYADNED